jgi:hypothetical protein
MTRDISASVRGRLENAARESGRPLQELMQYFVMERFLFRLSKSRHAERFVLKGALMFRVWGTPQSRATRFLIATPASRCDLRVFGVKYTAFGPESNSRYSSIASTSATNRWLLSARNALITLNTESLKPPMFIMSARSQA